ncbi:pro-sigmaK processing inhibitor BofA family protein [Mangrovibacillus cuniculi]|uniref:Pro-sigmaK processing inhibitor BofA n=1 Tax=Mangrovibacillus cuniculi TaxID=2593652 RepID=A0A7S8HHG1_9BACI|nr:pro-sigmaK processing inhibitor BofA family protein [Mangrovibacillus cuniculi]QPC48470.1 pro-sigmaK processing inhibitor BofA [Mangrovibacillus cuniculi]
MEPVLVIGIVCVAVVFLLTIGSSIKPVKWIGLGITKIIIGAIFLFLLNTLGSSVGIHVPINLLTSTISGVLGIPGVAALTVIQYLIV